MRNNEKICIAQTLKTSDALIIAIGNALTVDSVAISKLLTTA